MRSCCKNIMHNDSEKAIKEVSDDNIVGHVANKEKSFVKTR